MSPVLEAANVRFTYRGADHPALDAVSFRVDRGEHAAIVGPNGAGKSTLLRLLSGVTRPESGTVHLLDRETTSWGRREAARVVAVVGQLALPDFPISVREFVELGRNPYLSPWQSPGVADRSAVEEALLQTELTTLASRRIGELSAGERQRTALARALAQRAAILLLDEPTAHLDLGHELGIFERLAALIAERGLTAVSVTHSLHLASRFADRLLLLAGGHAIAEGSPQQVLTETNLERAFAWPVMVLELEELGVDVIPLAGGSARG